MVWAWMLSSSDAVEQERHHVLAWMLSSSDAIEHEGYNGLGMDALVIGCSRI